MTLRKHPKMALLPNLVSKIMWNYLYYINIPTLQVLAKASKIIPVMAMGWIISRKTYEKYEYAVAMLISSGMFLFLYGSPGSVSGSNSSTTTSFSGLILLIGYMSSDAFTSNWQKELYDTYKISPFQVCYICTYMYKNLEKIRNQTAIR